MPYRLLRLASSDGNHVVDVVNAAAAAEVVYGARNTLKDGADGRCSAETLHELVADVADFEARGDEYVGMSCDSAAGSLLLAYAWNEGGVGLKLAVNLQFRPCLASYACGLNDLVHNLVRGGTLRAETQHGNAGVFDACHGASCLSRAVCKLRKLLGSRNGRDGNVAHDEHALLAVLRLVGDEEHGSADACDAGGARDDLQRGTQRVARRAESTANLAVGLAVLDDEAAEIERVLYEFASLFDGHALLLAQLLKHLRILPLRPSGHTI